MAATSTKKKSGKYRSTVLQSIKTSGPPAYHPTQKDKEMVWIMAAAGIPQTRIAELLDINVQTLAKHFREELIKAEQQANAAVVNALYRNAVYAMDVRAQIFWCKTRLRWRETDRLELGGFDGKPIEQTTTHQMDLKRLSVDQLLQLRDLMRAASPSGEVIDVDPVAAGMLTNGSNGKHGQ